MMPRTPHILLIDDDEPEGCVNALKSALLRSLGEGNYRVDTPKTFNEGREFLEGQGSYSLILLDLRLDGEHEWGGAVLLDEHWETIHQKRSRVILYSGKPTAIDAYQWFKSGRGPFQFCRKANEHEPGSDFLKHIISQLRIATHGLCQRASPASIWAWKSNTSDWSHATVEIDDDVWSVASLLRPWLCRLDGEPEGVSEETLLTALFPSDDLVRVFSYWCKGQVYKWPGTNQMYGLTPLTRYHLGSETGSMDPLMHRPQQPDKPDTFKFREAGAAALRDLHSLRCALNDQATYSHICNYIDRAQQWTAWCEASEGTQAIEFKETVTFRPVDLVQIFKSKGASVDISERIKCHWEYQPGILKYGMRQFYCPPYRINTNDDYQPSVKYGIEQLAVSQSAADRSGNNWKVIIDSYGELMPEDPPGQLPYLVLVVCLSGRLSGSRDIAGWIDQPGRHLWQVRESLRGCAQWCVLVGDGENPPIHYAFLGSEPSDEEAEQIWKKYNTNDDFHVLHLLKLGMPV